MKQTAMLVVSLRGANFGFWCRLGCSAHRNIIQTEYEKKMKHEEVTMLLIRWSAYLQHFSLSFVYPTLTQHYSYFINYELNSNNVPHPPLPPRDRFRNTSAPCKFSFLDLYSARRDQFPSVPSVFPLNETCAHVFSVLTEI